MKACSFGMLSLACAALLMFPATARAQSGSAIAGVVKDTSGAVMPGVTVEVAGPELIEKSKPPLPTSAACTRSSTCGPASTR